MAFWRPFNTNDNEADDLSSINFRCVPIRQTTENTSKAICPTAGGETFDEAMNWYERGSSQNVNVSDNTNTSSTSAISSQCSNGRPRKLAALFRPTTSKASLISERHTIEKRKKSVASLTTEIEPPDPYGLVHVIFFFFGLGMMLPLSFFLTAQQYWMYKFRDPSSEEIDLDHKTELQANFVSFSSISQSVPSVITTILATRYGHKINIRTRLMSTLLVMLAAFVVFTGFIEINTDSWQVPFFFLSMLVSVIITMSGTTALVTVLSLIARFPQTYMKTQMYGSAGAGLFSAILQIFSLAIGKDPKSTALIYFSGGTIVVFLTTVFAYISNYSARFRYHLGDVVADTRKETQSLSDLFRTAKKIYPHVILVIVGVLTNGMGHPNITTLIVSENYGNGSAWNDKYFTPVITFFWADIVNIFGRMFGRPILTPKRAGWYLLVDLSRIVAFCPLYLFCNAKSSHPRHLPILFPHDWQYIVIHSFNMFLAHFFGTCSFLSVKNMIPEDPEQELMVLQNFIGVLSLISSPLGTLWVHVL